jgi:hypothetical protein
MLLIDQMYHSIYTSNIACFRAKVNSVEEDFDREVNYFVHSRFPSWEGKIGVNTVLFNFAEFRLTLPVVYATNGAALDSPKITFVVFRPVV